MMAERPLDSDRQLLGHDIESDQLRHRSFSYFLSSLLRLRQRDAIRERLYFGDRWKGIFITLTSCHCSVSLLSHFLRGKERSPSRELLTLCQLFYQLQ
ncbi:MAG: hypothetical protein ACYT04_31630 [Nostoc sp.]